MNDFDFQGEANPGFTDYTISDDPSNPYGWASGWGGDTLSAMGAADDTQPKTQTGWEKLLGNLKNLGGKAADFAQTPQGIMALLSAIMTMRDRLPKTGGGVGTSYAGYKPLTRTITPSQTPGAPSPIVRYAAQGGIMHAYAQGGAVRPFPMQDGGFVLTKRAVDGAGGPEGMRQHVPEAVPIRGPGHGTSDSIPAYIQGPSGRTPAKVSNGEMYVPPGRDTRGLYALMRAMERKA